jgi:hypothetical protein
MPLPKDPALLLSVINTKLRDAYPSLGALCDDLGESESEIKSALSLIGYEYNEELNQFK